MATPARFTPAPLRPAKIGTCDAEFEVTAPNGPLSSPETLLAAVRREILPALSDLLDARPWCDLDINVDQIEIDLGAWPDEPVWSEVRYVLAHKLETALSRYVDSSAESGSETDEIYRSGQQHSARHRHPTVQTPADIGHQSDDQKTGATDETAQGQTTPHNLPLQETPGFKSRRAAIQSSGTSRNAASPQDATSITGVPPKDDHGSILTPMPLDMSGAQSPPPASRKSDRARPNSATDPDNVHDPATRPIGRTQSLDPARTRTPQDPTADQNAASTRPDQTPDTSPDLTPSNSAADANDPNFKSDGARDHTMTPKVNHQAPSSAETSARRVGATGHVTPPDVQDTTVDQNTSSVEPKKTADHQPDTSEIVDTHAQDPAASFRAGNPDQANASPKDENTADLARQGHIAAFIKWSESTASTINVQEITKRLDEYPQERLALHAWATDPKMSHNLYADVPETLRILVIRTLAPSAQDLQRGVTHRNGSAPVAGPSDLGYIRDLIWQVARDTPRAGDALEILDQVQAVQPDFFATTAGATDQETVFGAPTPADKRAISTATVRLAASLRRSGHGQHSATRKAAELVAGILLRKEHHARKQIASQSIETAVLPKNTAIDHDPTALDELADLFDLNKTQPIAPALAQIFNQDPMRFLSRLDRAGATSHLPLVLADPACEFNAVLTANSLNGAQLRTIFRADQNKVSAALVRLSAAQLLDLARQSLPPNADLLADALDKLAQSAKSPANALYRAVLALFQDRPLDIEALMKTSPDAAQLPVAEPQKADETSPDAKSAPDQTPVSTKSEAPFSHVTEHRAGSTETPFETLLALDGFTQEEIQRILGTPDDASRTELARARTATPGKQAPSDVMDPAKVPRTSDAQERAMSPDSSDAQLRARLDQLATFAQTPSEQVFGAALRLIWHVWPHAPSGFATAGEATDFHLLRLIIETATRAKPAPKPLAQTLALALKTLVPADDTRAYALRVASARLASLPGPDADGLQRMTREAVEQIIADPALAEPDADGASPAAGKTAVSPVSEPEIEPDTLLISDTAGLVLLHPFYVLLFERLKVERDGKRLATSALPRAFGLLAALGGTENAPTIDPLHRVLLGLPPTGPVPLPETPDADAITLMDGLLRSVIERWGRLGATSPDGLRDTFLRRTGSLRQDENGVHLRVTPGPFDMLLDALPWSPGPVTLPWMPLPCHVTWREDKDA